jgi:hypothetical protein
MAKKPEARGTVGTEKSGHTSAAVGPTITVVEGDKRSSEELMKLPKAQIVREMSISEDRTRFMVDVDNQSKQGKRIITLMESLCDGNAAAIKTITGILEALAGMVAEKPTPEK